MKKHLTRVKNTINNPTIKGILGWMKANKFKTFLIAFLIWLFIIYTDQFKAFIVLTAFFLISSTITIYKRVIRMPPVFEFISLTTVMVTLFWGPIVGMIYTIFVNLASEVFSGYPDVMTLTYIPSRSIQVWAVWVLAGLTSMSVTAIGIWSVVIFNVVQQPIFMFLTDTEQRLKALYFIILNIPVNIIIFRLLAEPLNAVLSAVL